MNEPIEPKVLPILHVSLCQMNYIVPIIYALRSHFEFKFYYVFNKSILAPTVCTLELIKLNLINSNNLITVTQKEFDDIVCSYVETPVRNGCKNLFFITNYSVVFTEPFKYTMTQLKPIVFSYNHGIDEEILALGRKNDFTLNDLLLNTCLYSAIYKERIQSTYKIDPEKKTIVVFDTIAIDLLKNIDPSRKILYDYSNNLINVLIELKKKYNVILRFHPQEAHGLLLGKYQCNPRLFEHFVIDLTPIPVINFYEIADIIITSRFSASGYQALFIKDKIVILLETNFDDRTRLDSLACGGFIKSHTNQKIDQMKLNNQLISDDNTYCLYENNIHLLFDIIAEITVNNYINKYEQSLDLAIHQIYKLKRYTLEEILEMNPLDNYVKKFTLY